MEVPSHARSSIRLAGHPPCSYARQRASTRDAGSPTTPAPALGQRAPAYGPCASSAATPVRAASVARTPRSASASLRYTPRQLEVRERGGS